MQTGESEELPTSKQMEKQKVVLDQLKNTLDLNIDKLDKYRYVGTAGARMWDCCDWMGLLSFVKVTFRLGGNQNCHGRDNTAIVVLLIVGLCMYS